LGFGVWGLSKSKDKEPVAGKENTQFY
jgi:hypothetical protein